MTRRYLLALTGVLLAVATDARTSRADDLLIPKGTVIPVALLNDISTASVRAGDKIKAIYMGDDEGGFPEGTVFVAEVVKANAKSAKESGSVSILFKQAVLPGNKTIAIQGKPVNIKPNTGQKDKKKDTGKGAAIGAGAGVLLGGRNMTGVLLGGATGAVIGNKTGNKPQDLTFKKGSSFGIELIAAARVPQPKTSAPKPRPGTA